jgi:hypothetical protein
MAKNKGESWELGARGRLQSPVGAHCEPAFTGSMLHSRPASPVGIPGRFSSSLLPPLFPPGRCAAIFIQGLRVPLLRADSPAPRGGA